MKRLISIATILILVSASALGADYFFFRGKDSDVPTAVRFVRVLDHQQRPVKDAKIAVSLRDRSILQGVTDATGTVTFPRCDVARVEEVRCEIKVKADPPFVVTIAGDSRSIAWPVIFTLRPRPTD